MAEQRADRVREARERVGVGAADDLADRLERQDAVVDPHVIVGPTKTLTSLSGKYHEVGVWILYSKYSAKPS